MFALIVWYIPIAFGQKSIKGHYIESHSKDHNSCIEKRIVIKKQRSLIPLVWNDIDTLRFEDVKDIECYY